MPDLKHGNVNFLASTRKLLFNILNRKSQLSRTKYEHLWAGLNFIFTLFLAADIFFAKQPRKFYFNFSVVWWIEIILAVAFGLNTFVHVYFFLWHVFTEPYLVPPKWKKLVGIENEGYDGKQWKFFEETSQQINLDQLQSHNKFRLENFEFWHRMRTWKWPVILRFREKPACRIASDTMKTMRSIKLRPYRIDGEHQMPKLISDKQAFINSHKPQPIHTEEMESLFVTFQRAKDSYIKEGRNIEEIHDLTNEYYAKAAELRDSYNPHKVTPEVQKMLDDYKKRTSAALEMSVPLEQFKYYLPPGSLENNVGILKKHRYQQFIRAPSPLDDDPPAICSGNVWANLRVTEGMLNVWGERLRKWICQTILVRLVDEIESLNKKFVEMKFTGVQIGGTNVITLQHLAAMRSTTLPTLLALVPYLDVHSNQEYLVKRMRELAVGCMRTFKGNGGCSLRGRPWTKDLPNDSDIVLHLFSTYLDSVMPCDSVSGKKKTFTNNYVRKVPDKPIYDKGRHYLYQSKKDLPHFVVIIDEEVYGVPKGPDNLFTAIVLLLHYIKTKENNLLGRVNLGPSGLNILGVLEW